jgi:hypothetical protein
MNNRSGLTTGTWLMHYGFAGRYEPLPDGDWRTKKWLARLHILVGEIMINSKMKTFNEFVVEPQSDGLFEMANISPKRTGLPFVVWISPKAGAPHDVRVKVSKGPKVHSADLVSVAIRPDVHVVSGGKMTAHDLALLRKWVELNHDVIVKYWDGDIEYIEDAIAALKAIH